MTIGDKIQFRNTTATVVKYEGMGTYIVATADGKHYRMSGMPFPSRKAS